MSTLKRWTALGLGAALIAGCSQPADADKAADQPQARQMGAGPGESGEGEGGAGGESGEGGVNVAAAATDPTVYLSALAVVEAHIRAAAAAAEAGERQAAGEMFAHPVSEILIDMAPTFQTLGVAPFDDQLLAASQATFEGADVAALKTRADGILTTLDQAAAKAPGGTAGAAVLAGVIADQIDRAAMQYGTAKGSDAYEPYLDGYGFYVTAKAMRDEHADLLRREQPQALAAIDAALQALSAAYPTARRPQSLTADAGPLIAASSRAKLAVTR
jgi:hypothetical protein